MRASKTRLNSLRCLFSIVSLLILIGFCFHGAANIVFGLCHGNFVVSDNWRTVSIICVSTLPIIYIIVNFASNRLRKRLLRNGLFQGMLVLLCTSYLLIFICDITVSYELPKLINEIIGQQEVKSFMVKQDADLNRWSFRHDQNYTYCALISDGRTILIHPSYCIKPEDYNNLSSDYFVSVKFHGIGSLTGFKIEGYYSGYTVKKLGQVEGVDEFLFESFVNNLFRAITILILFLFATYSLSVRLKSFWQHS